LQLVEKHTVKEVTAHIRIQEYGPLVFNTLPSRSSVKKAIKKGLIFINGKQADSADWIEEGQLLEVFQLKPTTKHFKLNLDVLFEDDYVAVINKPAGYPTSGNFFKTIARALPYNLKISTKNDSLLPPQPIHRLDNPTSGVLVVAKTKSSQINLNKQLELKGIQKTYIAVVHNTPDSNMLFNDNIDGKESESKLEIIKTFKVKDDIYSLVELFPKTGRTHQLRIHTSKAGFPIVGDQLYGISSEKNKKLLLHAKSIQFKHPVTGNEVFTTSELPKRFEKLLNLS
jgi:tRNA pseudouridine65 synthase/23S rRNA pseudouridine1911/1915/1917 synthase